MLPTIKTLILLLLAAALAVIGLLFPAHLRTVDSSVLQWSGEQGRSSADKAREVLSAAHIGPAQRIAAASDLDEPTRHELQQRVNILLARNGQYHISGGPAPYFEAFLQSAHPTGLERDTPNAVLSLLLPRSERRLLVETLSESSNANIASLLSTRNLRGLIRLHPADHAAGAPYDAGVLSLALLIQGNYFKPGLAQEIGVMAQEAASGNVSAVGAFEDFTVGTLSLARRLDFRSLASLAEITETPTEWAEMGALFRAQPDRINALYTTLRFSQQPSAVYQYIAEHPESSNQDLDEALGYGPGAVEYLLESKQAIFRERSLLADTLVPLQAYRPSFFVSLTAENRNFGLIAKFASLTLAGLAFAFAMGAAWRGSLSNDTERVSRHNPSVLARDALISLVVAITLWTLAEPDVLKSHEDVADSAPRIEFAVASTLDSLKSPVKAMQELNQVTLLVLALFFIIQLVIYSFCLIKLREISKQSVGPELKLRLLDNEEQLFDFGLYVGLGGTVLSLILVAVGIVEASLMAAYASTLFGILFVALLKVLHLRPYRRKLIMQSGLGQSPSGPVETAKLMKDIEL